jgi:hypothetical protein
VRRCFRTRVLDTAGGPGGGGLVAVAETFGFGQLVYSFLRHAGLSVS